MPVNFACGILLAGYDSLSFTMQIVGDRRFVSTVDKGSDAETKGVKAGDEVLEA